MCRVYYVVRNRIKIIYKWMFSREFPKSKDMENLQRLPFDERVQCKFMALEKSFSLLIKDEQIVQSCMKIQAV